MNRKLSLLEALRIYNRGRNTETDFYKEVEEKLLSKLTSTFITISQENEADAKKQMEFFKEFTTQ